jgi:hypothetical protein
LGRIDEGIAELHQSVELSSRLGWMLATLGSFFALLGRRTEALSVVAELEQRAQTEYVKSFLFAMIHACLGDEPTALIWLEKSIEERDLWLPYLGCDTELFVGHGISRKHLSPGARAALIDRLGLVLD